MKWNDILTWKKEKKEKEKIGNSTAANLQLRHGE